MSWLLADSATIDQEPTLAEQARAIQNRQSIPSFRVRAQGEPSQLRPPHPDDEIHLLPHTCLIPIKRPWVRLLESPLLCSHYGLMLHLAC